MTKKKVCKHVLFIFLVASVSVGLLPLSGFPVEKKLYKIAYIGPLTGPNTSVGTGVRNSLDLCIQQANRLGVLPFRLEVVSETDDSKPSVGVAAVQKFCGESDVVAASAHFNSPVALATNPFFDKCPLLNVIPSSASNKITQQGYEAIVRVSTNFGHTFAFAGREMYRQLKIKNVAILHSMDDYGVDIRDEVKKEFEKAGGRVVATEGFNVGDRDFTPILTKLKSNAPDGIFLGCLSTEAALITRQKSQLGIKSQLVGQAGWQTEAYIKAAGEAGEGAIVAIQAPFPETLPEGLAFIKAYQEAGYKDPYDVYGVCGYTAGQVIVELLKRHGPDRMALIKGVRKIKDFDTLIGKKKYFDEAGELKPKPEGWGILKNGKWQPYTP